MALPRPLAGVRVLDFTWVRAGPWTTRWLGAFGAEIVKIEWPERLDILRSNCSTVPPGVAPGPNATGQLYVSMAGFGHTGRHHHYTTMGPSAQALSGLTFLSGLPGKPPAGWGWSYLGDTGGMYDAMCALTALRHRNATGKGQHVDLSQMTTGITLTGAAFLNHTVNGRQARRQGYPPGNRTVWPGTPPVNSYRGPTVAPYNAYHTKGGSYNDWCVIACFSDQE